MTTAGDVPPTLLLLVGDEEFLVERAVGDVVAALRRIDPQTELRRAPVSELTLPELTELLSPSLFGESRVVVLGGAQEAGKDIAGALLGYAKDPADGLTLVVAHSGGGRSKAGKELPAALRKAGAEIVECAKITKQADRDAFVRAEIRRAGGRIDAAASAALLESVGSDLRELSAAASQLVADTGGAVDEPAVRRYHRGRAEVTGFVVAEKAVNGDRAGALEALRWASLLGVPHVLVADALADAVRTVARVAAVGRSDPFRLASELGMPPWKVKRALAQARGWDEAGLADAMQIVAAVNADVKGAAADFDYALERAVLRVAGIPAGRAASQAAGRATNRAADRAGSRAGASGRR
ncbi:MAG TPA: DNA polymerase III subunit delta [Pseudonocardiaceae bacterium]|nr:DNA polymerase III subunit delta [Pseudonocardiaceae bacterium]